MPVGCWMLFKAEWNVIAEERFLFSAGEQVGFHWITNVCGNVAADSRRVVGVDALR